MNIAIYSRKSKFTEKGDSIDNQIQYCKDFAETHFSHIPDKNYILYEDEGYSAANTYRPMFQKLLADIKKRSIHMLLCYRLDRITRNVSDFSKTLDMLEKYEAAFVSATENFDTSTPMGKAMIYIASVFAQLERETTAERVRDNMLALSHTGRWLGGATPLGFESEAILYMDENYKERQLFKLIPVETELLTVKILFQKYMETRSLSQVEQYCLINHIKTRKYCDFTKSSIAQILQNPVYCIADMEAYHYFESLECVMACDTGDFNGAYGILSYNRTRHHTGKKQIKRPPAEWVIATGKHQGIIEGKTFVKVQKLIKENKSKGSPRANTSEIALLSGKITCCGCGAKLRVKNIRKSTVHTTFCYACEMKILSKGSRCGISNIPGNILDTAILRILGDLLSNGSQNYIPYLKQKKAMLFDTANESKKKLELLTAEENLLNNSIKTLLSQLTGNESPLTVKYILPRLKELDKSLQLIQNEIIDLKTAKEEFLETGTEVSSLYYTLTDIRTLIKNSGLLSQKLLLDSLIEQIEWDGESVSITLKTAAPENFSRDRGSRFHG